jgi:hypothetical protein
MKTPQNIMAKYLLCLLTEAKLWSGDPSMLFSDLIPDSSGRDDDINVGF